MTFKDNYSNISKSNGFIMSMADSDWTIVNNGDELEKNSSEFVHKHLQHYEKIWSIFIGHSGNGLMANMSVKGKENIPDQIQKKSFNFLNITIQYLNLYVL
ncbi:MAG: hypothetical protein IPL24_05925 [Bacteroidetes bacterium]|nr:hypothetical protein [Bacteroidota bacterium]